MAAGDGAGGTRPGYSGGRTQRDAAADLVLEAAAAVLVQEAAAVVAGVRARWERERWERDAL
jgi:hypothetical protein